jgi:DNA polymerase III subunit chi
VPQVDFYILAGSGDDARFGTVCRIAEKAMRSHQRIYVNVGSPEAARRLDELLWTFSQGSFIPHRVIGHSSADASADEPVLIGYSLAAPPDGCDVLINLTDEMPETGGNCRRVIEVVDSEPARRDRGRERYRIYRERGFKLNVHQL